MIYSTTGYMLWSAPKHIAARKGHIFLFLVIQMPGVTAIASCQAMLGPRLMSKSSSKVPMKLIRNTIMLNRQNPINPVVTETNSCCTRIMIKY